MARARNIKPGFCRNEDLAECSVWARLCFALLPMLADREGRLEDRPKRIKGDLFPFDSVEVGPLLAELDKHELIARYEINGLGLIQILGFRKHQNPHHREPESTLPPHPSLRLDADGKYVKPEALPPSQQPSARGKPEARPGTEPLRGDLPGGPNPADSGALIPDSGFRTKDAEANASAVDGEPPTDGRPPLTLVEPTPELPDCPHQEVVALYAKHLPGHRKPVRWDGERAESLRTRWRECSKPSSFGDGYRTKADGLVFWDRYFAYVASTPKLRDGITSRENGQVRVWRPDLAWLVVRGNFTKVIEGAYAE